MSYYAFTFSSISNTKSLCVQVRYLCWSETGSLSLGIHSFFLSFFALSSSLITLLTMIYRFYFFFNLLDKSLGAAHKLSGFTFAPYYFPIWNLKSHFYVLFSLQCISILCGREMSATILYLEAWKHLFN